MGGPAPEMENYGSETAEKVELEKPAEEVKPEEVKMEDPYPREPAAEQASIITGVAVQDIKEGQLCILEYDRETNVGKIRVQEGA